MGGSSGGSTNTVQKSDPWSGEQPYLTQGMQAASDWYNGSTPSYYPGSTVAPQSSNTTNAYNMMADQVTNNPLQAASTGQVKSTLDGSYLNGNPYMDAEFQAGTRAIDNNYNAMVNGQTSGAEAGGRYGSGMQAFQKNQADQTLGDNLNNLYANTYGANYTQERQNQVNAVGQAGAVQDQGITNANALGTVGSAQDQYAQSLTDANVNKWNYNQNLGYNKLANYMGLINGNYGSSSTTSTPTSGTNMFGNIVGAGMAGLGAYGAFSDRRLKEDVKRIGFADNGLPIYSFRYKDTSQTVIGFMADEVEELHPEAVMAHPSGFKMVDYGRAVEMGA